MPSKSGSKSSSRVNLKISRRLADQVEAYVARHPELALGKINTAISYILRRWLEEDLKLVRAEGQADSTLLPSFTSDHHPE